MSGGGQGKADPLPERTEWIWHDGEIVPWDAAQLHVMSHVVHYGSSVFEGIRFYDTPNGPATFRLSDHMRRFANSARIYRMDLGLSIDGLSDACREVVNRNGLESGYIRPVALRGLGALGLHPGKSPVETYIVAYPWGQYLGTEALQEGVDVCVSSWSRPAPNTLPTLAKAGGNYVNSQLMRMEAEENGYAEAIGLGPTGLVSEGSGQNVFVVDSGVLYTPPIDGTLLAGITRDSVLRLAANLGIPTREQAIPREMLYIADELFFTGTASEITPIRSVDRLEIGGGGVGPITQTLQKEYLGIATGERPDPYGWLEPINQPTSEPAASEPVL
jgi:branched-chain amino acid aminotransferase